jgi:hypothetical protein
LGVSCYASIEIKPPSLLGVHPSFEEKINYTLDLAKYKLFKTIGYLEKQQKKELLYPIYTENLALTTQKNRKRLPDGFYHLDTAKFWAAGAFPGLLWNLYEEESDLKLKQFWRNKAILWSNELQQRTRENVKDMTINNLFAFRPWVENSTENEKKIPLEMIFEGARSLSEPINLTTRVGQYSEKLGVMGYFLTAKRTDKKEYWQAFIDHSINVEQLLWAAQENPNQEEAKRWKTIALGHIKTLAKYMGKNRQPGTTGTWQRGYFEINPYSANYGKFMFNEGKQGWKDESTWSRGQAWWIYAVSVTYQYTQDPQILTIAKEAINYYFNHLPDRFPQALRIQNDLIPPWDFDYALQVNPNTEKDTSAAAIAVSGILKLVQSLPTNDPDKSQYLETSKQILNQLMSYPYLATPKSGMSLLLQGCYHHPESISPTDMYNNGLIWGDYFFLDALKTYQQLVKS